MACMQGGSDLPRQADSRYSGPRPTDRYFASPEDLSRALLDMSPEALDTALGHAAAMRFRHRHETVCDLIVGALCMGVSPMRLFDSLDIS